MSDKQPPQSTLQARQRGADERLDDIEEFLSRVLARARNHPVGRKILAYLGIP